MPSSSCHPKKTLNRPVNQSRALLRKHLIRRTSTCAPRRHSAIFFLASYLSSAPINFESLRDPPNKTEISQIRLHQFVHNMTTAIIAQQSKHQYTNTHIDMYIISVFSPLFSSICHGRDMLSRPLAFIDAKTGQKQANVVNINRESARATSIFSLLLLLLRFPYALLSFAEISLRLSLSLFLL